MKRFLLLLSLYLTVFTLFGVATTPRANGQNGPQFVEPDTLYRFQVSDDDGGHLLTGWYGEGPANGYTYNQMNTPFFNGLGIYRPSPGYTPDPASGLVALHRWLVIQDGWRTYFYYSTGYLDLTGTDYHYQGIAGYVFPPWMTQTPTGFPLYQLSSYYSQSFGYWNGFGGGNGYIVTESPPNTSYYYQGTTCAMPAAVYNSQFPTNPFPGNQSHALDVLFYPPPPPPGGGGGGGGGTCYSPSGGVGACRHNGGLWNYESCECDY